MSTKLGFHITFGARKDYGPVVAQAPAVVKALGEHGALEEAKNKSNSRTITIYRTDKVYRHGDAPNGFPQLDEAQARQLADNDWPKFREILKDHPADYYQLTNEIGGGDDSTLQTTKNLIAFETRMMELVEAEPDPNRYKLAVASFAGGSPPWDMWVEYVIPFIKRAGEGGHIYSRHAYGDGMLTNPDGTASDGNAGRPFREAAELRRRGIKTPMIITEAGQNAGYDFPGVDAFMADIERFDNLCKQHENIWGFCAWTYGDWNKGDKSNQSSPGPANIMDASSRIERYLEAKGGANRPTYPSILPIAQPAAATPESAEFTPESVEADFVRGYVWQNTLRPEGDQLEITVLRNFRSEPKGRTTSNLIGQLMPGTIVRIDQSVPKPAHYYPVLVRGSDIVSNGHRHVSNGQIPSASHSSSRQISSAGSTFFTGIHGPGSDSSWLNGAFRGMMTNLNMPVMFMSHGINKDYAGFGDRSKNVVRIVWNPRAVSADAAYDDFSNDQLRPWYERGYRRFIFFNEVQLSHEVTGQSDEGMGISWHSAEEFAPFLKTCLQRARQDFPGIFLFTTPMTSNSAFAPWHWRTVMWQHVSGLVDGWAMHAYTGEQHDPDKAAQEIADQVTALKHHFQLRIPIIVSETSVNRGHNPPFKAKVAHLLLQKLSNVTGVEGVYWFAADWDPGFDVNHEGWFRNGIADEYIDIRDTVTL